MTWPGAGLADLGAPAVVNSPQFAFMSRCIQEGTGQRGQRPWAGTVIPDPPGRPSS